MGTAQDRIANYKNFDSQLQTVDLIESFDQTEITIHGFENCKSEITKSNRKFGLKIEGVFSTAKVTNRISIRLNEKDYILKSSDFTSHAVHVSIFEGVSATHTFDVQGLQSDGWKNETRSKFRCIFPTDIDLLGSFCFLFKTTVYENGTTVYAFDCIRLKLENKTYDVVQVKKNGKGYYIFDSLEEQSLEEFQEVCYAIQQSLGFFVGYMPGGEKYVFSGDDFIYSNYTRPALKSIFNPVNSNAYSKLYDNKDAAAEFQGKLTLIPMETVANLTSLIKKNKKVSVTIILLLEAANARSLLMIPSMFSVIIESLAKIIATEETGKVLPISNKEVSKRIIKKLTEVIDNNSADLSEEGALKIKRRLLAINNPMVNEKFTNNERLTRPFEQLGIKLTIEDIIAIEHRNDLLHGNILLDTGEELTSEEEDNYMAYISGKLFTLISKLILKYAGYDGYVINYAKLYNPDCNEDYYDKI